MPEHQEVTRSGWAKCEISGGRSLNGDGLAEVDWKYYDVCHTSMDLLNPVLPAQMERLLDVLSLKKGDHVHDIACGKGEFLLRLHRRYGITGDGVDLSPHFLGEARRRANAVGAEGDGGPLRFHLMDGAEFKPGRSADLACCIGATWIWGGVKGTLKALAGMAKKGGMVLIGEPFWKADPTADYLESAGAEAAQFMKYEEILGAAGEEGLRPLYILDTGVEAFDHYYSMYAVSFRKYSSMHPDDPDLKKIGARMEKEVKEYFARERFILGWGMFLFEKP